MLPVSDWDNGIGSNRAAHAARLDSDAVRLPRQDMGANEKIEARQHFPKGGAKKGKP